MMETDARMLKWLLCNFTARSVVMLSYEIFENATPQQYANIKLLVSVSVCQINKGCNE